uniref:hypothetical protein n=1 Tax=Cupriavidus yeoncheonensis TaxID=1462994 RepID=UPI003F49300C
MLDDGIERKPCGVHVFKDVVPQQLIDEINATIDICRDDWHPADGRRASRMAMRLANRLRKSERFAQAELRAYDTFGGWAHQSGRAISGEPLYVLRCVNASMPQQSHLRHYDSHLLTLLIPLQVASASNENGDLIVYRQRRRSVSVMSNLLAKAWLIGLRCLPFMKRQGLTYRHLERGLCDRIACLPGNVYAFNGFFTLHANLHVEAGERRTLIIHYYNPGLTAGLHVVPRALRALRERLLGALS